MEYHVNKSKDITCSGMAKVVIERLKKLENHYKKNNIKFSYSQNSKLRNNKNYCKNISINGLIFIREQGTKKDKGQLSMVGSSLCKNFNELNSHLIIKTLSEPCHLFLSSSYELKAASEMFDSFTCLSSTTFGNNGKKTETLPCTDILLCEKLSFCDNSKVKRFMDTGNNKKLLHKNYMTTLFPVFKTSSHKNVFYEAKPNQNILLKQSTMSNYKKNNYFKEFRKRTCFSRYKVDSGCNLYIFMSPIDTRKQKKEKVTNTSITCIDKVPTKSYMQTKKIIFLPKREMCAKSSSSNCVRSSCNPTSSKNCKKDSKIATCKKRLFKEKLNKFIALNTLLEEITPDEKHKIFKCLAQNGIALPTATTLCEKMIMNKVQKELKISNRMDKLQSSNCVKSLKINFLKPLRYISQANFSFIKKHLISEKNCAHGELSISNDNLNDKKVTEILAPPAKRHIEIKEYIGLVGKPKLKKVQTDKCNLHRTWPTCSKKEKRAWNLRKNCGPTKKTFLVGLTVQNDQGRKCSFLKRIKRCKLFNKKNFLVKIEPNPFYFLEENHNDEKLFTLDNKIVKLIIGRPTVRSQCELKHLKNSMDESRILKLNRLSKINNQILFIYEQSHQIGYRLYGNIVENSKRNIGHKDTINVFNSRSVDEQKSSKDLLKIHSTLSLREDLTIESSLSPNIRTNSKITVNLLQKCSPFYIPSKSVMDFNCNNLIERKYFEDVFMLRCKNHVCSFPLERSPKFITSRSLPCMETDLNKNIHYKNVYKTEEKYFSTTMFVVAVNVKKSKNLDLLCCDDSLNHSRTPMHFYGRSNEMQDPKCFKVNHDKHSAYKATSLQECANVRKNMNANIQVKDINSKKTRIVPELLVNTLSEKCFYLLGKITDVQKNVFSQYATEKRIRFKCPDEVTVHRNKRSSQSSLSHQRRKHTCCIKDNDGTRTSDFFRYPEHKSNTSLNNTQKRKSMSYKSKRIQTQLSLLQTNSSFFLKDAQNQAKLFEPQCETFQYRPKKYMLKKRSGEEFDKGGKSSSDICKSLRRNLYPHDSKLKKNTSSLSTHNSRYMIKEAPSPKRILIKGHNRRKWRGISRESLGDVKKCWCKILDKYKWRLKEIYSPTYSRPLAFTQNLKYGATCDLLEDKGDLPQENKEYKLTFSDFKGLTEEQLKCIIKQLKQTISDSNEIPSNRSFENNMTSEEEMMFYCDYAATLNNDMLSTLNSEDNTSSIDDDEESTPQGIKLHIRPNSRTLDRKWWSFFIKDL